jgi:hypothetical protein
LIAIILSRVWWAGGRLAVAVAVRAMAVCVPV